MPRSIRSIAAIAAALLVASFPHRASAQTAVTTGKATLRGLPGVEIEVEPLEQDVERDGLTRAMIQADVTNRLRAAGVTVYASQTANPSPGKPYLYVHVNGVKVATPGLWALSIEVQVRETVRSLVTTSDIVDATTWDHDDVLVVPVAQLPSARTVILEFVDDFIQDWKAVH